MINQIIKGMLSREEVAEGLRERGLAVSKDNIDIILFTIPVTIEYTTAIQNTHPSFSFWARTTPAFSYTSLENCNVGWSSAFSKQTRSESPPTLLLKTPALCFSFSSPHLTRRTFKVSIMALLAVIGNGVDEACGYCIGCVVVSLLMIVRSGAPMDVMCSSCAALSSSFDRWLMMPCTLPID